MNNFDKFEYLFEKYFNIENFKKRNCFFLLIDNNILNFEKIKDYFNEKIVKFAENFINFENNTPKLSENIIKNQYFLIFYKPSYYETEIDNNDIKTYYIYNFEVSYIKINFNNNIISLNKDIIDFLSNRVIPINIENIFFDPSFNNEKNIIIKNSIDKIIEESLIKFRTSQIMSYKWFKNIFKFLYHNINLIKKGYKNNLNILTNNLPNNIENFNNIPNYLTKENNKENMHNDNENNINIFLIGSSPNLDLEISNLKEEINYFDKNKKKYFTFCIDNSYFTLLRNNISPDFIISFDPATFTQLFILKKYIPFIKSPSIICPTTLNPKTYKNLKKVFLFNPGIDFEDEIFNFSFNSFNKIFINKFQNKDNPINFIKNLPILNFNITNVGSASLKIIYTIKELLKNNKDNKGENNSLNFTLKIYGIDYSFNSYKYYSKECFWQKYNRTNESYKDTTIKNNFKKCVYKNEKKLFLIYKEEFSNELEYLIKSDKIYEDGSLFISKNKSSILVPLLSYFYFIKLKKKSNQKISFNLKEQEKTKKAIKDYINKIILNLSL
ncbi:MAG: DUF115 domain-containing protein [Spirochaetes bacterium]|nr:DUF115 domain-containing protein [Spirochaetota bacterium]